MLKNPIYFVSGPLRANRRICIRLLARFPRASYLKIFKHTILPVLFFPLPAFAMTFVQVLGIFHIFVGIFLVITLLTFATGVFVYFARLGTWPTHRDTAILVLEWAVAELFILILLLAIVRLFERYTAIALAILSFIIVATVVILIVRAAAAPAKKKPAPPGRRPAAPPAR